MNKIILPILFLLAAVAALAQTSPEITYRNSATHIGKITADSIIIVGGSTYSFTVDTPEDKGLVSTKPSIKQLLSQLKAKDGSTATFKWTDISGAIKDDGEIMTGDKLIVTSQDGKATNTYHIGVRPMAVGGQLQLAQEKITVNAIKDL